MNDIIIRILAILRNKLLNFTLLPILKTTPIIYRPDENVTIVTMLSHDTVKMYLVAIKSFMTQFGYGNIEVINDGSLTLEDINILNHHVPGIRYSNSKEVNTLNCPNYISWKRLFRIAELAKKSYVIQLDSDTISLAPLIDIHDKVILNEGFLIGSYQWSQAVDVNFLHDIVTKWSINHVQPIAEAQFKNIDFFKDGTKYLRGCAGFAGYPKNFASESDIENLSTQLESKIGTIWHKWGSEQTATMCLISKTKNASILPWPKYQNFMMPITNEPIETASLVHFIGTTRYNRGKYRFLAKRFITK